MAAEHGVGSSELPVCPAEVTEHVFIARRCPLCRKRRLPQDPLREVAVGRQRLGDQPDQPDCVPCRRKAGCPWRTIQWYLQTVHQLKLSAGAIAGLLWPRPGLWRSRPGRNQLKRWNASAAVRWSTPMRPAGGRTESTAAFGPPSRGLDRLFSTSTERYETFPAPGPEDWGGGGRGPGRVLRRDSVSVLLRGLSPLTPA